MYKNPSPTVDVAVTDGKRILLVKRGKEPFIGKWVLPGGFIEYGEKVEDAGVREVLEETGIEVVLESILGVYSDPDRDPRKHIMTTVFVGRPIKGEPRGGDDAASAAWIDLASLDTETLAFDHGLVVEDLKRWLKHHSTFWSTKERS